MPAPFRIYNTLSRRVEDFEPVRPGHVGLYVCGMTVYDRAHVGHARAFVVFDSFVRYLRHREWEVTFVRNFTDVDDKIIVRSADTGEEPLALAQRFIDAFHEDVDQLGLVRPDLEHAPLSTTTPASEGREGRGAGPYGAAEAEVGVVGAGKRLVDIGAVEPL